MSREEQPEIRPFDQKHTLVIEDEDGVKGTTYIFDIELHSDKLLSNFALLRKFDILTDVSLIARDNHRYKFHSLLLASSSQLFRKTFAATPLHFVRGELAPLNVDHRILKTLQQFLYREEEVLQYDGDWNDLLDFASSFGFENMGSGFTDSEPLIISLHSMYIKQELTFCVLSVDGFDFPCHSSVVAASSPVIFHLLESHPLSLEFGKRIKVDGIQSKGIKPILDFIYTSQLHLTDLNVAYVMEAASYLQFTGVGWACANYVIKRLRPDNAFGSLQYARTGFRRNRDDFFKFLCTESYKYTVKCFAECLRHKDFLPLTTEDELLEYMKKADLNTLDHSILLSAFLKWYNYSRAEREKPFFRLVTGACYQLDLSGLKYVLAKLADR